jgi:hypothetical protein
VSGWGTTGEKWSCCQVPPWLRKEVAVVGTADEDTVEDLTHEEQ